VVLKRRRTTSTLVYGRGLKESPSWLPPWLGLERGFWDGLFFDLSLISVFVTYLWCLWCVVTGFLSHFLLNIMKRNSPFREKKDKNKLSSDDTTHDCVLLVLLTLWSNDGIFVTRVWFGGFVAIWTWPRLHCMIWCSLCGTQRMIWWHCMRFEIKLPKSLVFTVWSGDVYLALCRLSMTFHWWSYCWRLLALCSV